MPDRAAQERRTLVDPLAGAWVVAAVVSGDSEIDDCGTGDDAQFGVGDQDANEGDLGESSHDRSGPYSGLAVAAAAGELAQQLAANLVPHGAGKGSAAPSPATTGMASTP